MPGTRRRKVLNNPAATHFDRVCSDDRAHGTSFKGFAPRINCGTTISCQDRSIQLESGIRLKTFIQDIGWVVVGVWP